jgi:LysR family transcriptional regulator, hydrogen peroxide-inducible genes activator
MEFHQVRYFLALCEEQNFGKAAKRCGIAQPSLTKAMHRFERDIGGALFVRKPTAQPTPLALAIKPHLEQAIFRVDLARQEAGRVLSVESEPREKV